MRNKYIERPNVLAEEQARPLLEPYIPGLLDDFHDSWDWVQAILDDDPERRETFDSSTQAAMIYNRFALLLGRRHASNETVNLMKSGRMLRAVVADRSIAIRFKKLTEKIDGTLSAGNVKTNAQSLIYYQADFDGMGPSKPTEITFGYTVDETNTEIKGIYFTCPISWTRNKWHIRLEGEELEGALPFAAPIATDQDTGSAMVMITAKGKSKKQAEGA